MATVQSNAKAKASPAVAANAAKGGNPNKSQGETDKPKGKELVIPHLNAKAISKDVGPRVVRGLAKADQDIGQAEALMQAGKAAKANHLAELSIAIIKAAKVDTSIDLTTAVRANADKKEMGLLLDQLRLAIGVYEVQTVTTKSGEKPRLAYTDAVKDFFPAPGIDADSPEGIARNTLRSNFAHSLKKAAGVACGVIERNITAEMDKATGTLRLTGPEVQKQFGQKSVVLDEKKKVIPTDKKGKATSDPYELKEIPSFTAIQRNAEADHGKVPRAPVTNNRTKQMTDPDKAFESVCESLVKMIEALKGKPTERQIKALASVHSAIDPLL